MYYKSLSDSLEVSEERLFGAVREGVAEYLSGFKEHLKRVETRNDELEEELAALHEQYESLSAERVATDEEVLRRTKAIPIDFIERFAKECTSWAEAKPIYDLLVDYAEGDRDIKQKATNIKAHHTRRDNARMKQVYNGCTIATTGTINTLTATPSLRVIERRAE